MISVDCRPRCLCVFATPGVHVVSPPTFTRLVRYTSSHHISILAGVRSSMSEQNKTLIRGFLNSVNSRDWENLRMLLAPHFVRHSCAAGDPEVRSADELIDFLRNECTVEPTRLTGKLPSSQSISASKPTPNRSKL